MMRSSKSRTSCATCAWARSGFQAALDAADEIGLAVVATSATIIAVFLPVSFMGGITGQYFIQFGLTVAAAVFFSLLVARLITPVIAAYTLKPDSLIVHKDGPIMDAYLHALRWCVQHRWITLGGGTALLRPFDRRAGDGAEFVRARRRLRPARSLISSCPRACGSSRQRPCPLRRTRSSRSSPK